MAILLDKRRSCRAVLSDKVKIRQQGLVAASVQARRKRIAEKESISDQLTPEEDAAFKTARWQEHLLIKIMPPGSW